MSTGVTCSGPRALAASAATSDESTPPLNPTTTPSNPTLRTSSRMNPTRMPATSSGSIARTSAGGGAGSVAMTLTVTQTGGLTVGQVMTSIAQQWRGDA